MLSTIREYGIEQLKRLGEVGSAVQAHAQYVLTLVEQVQVDLELSQGPEQQSLDFSMLSATTLRPPSSILGGQTSMESYSGWLARCLLTGLPRVCCSTADPG